MPSIAGSCLCDAIHITVARAPRTLTQCNCSACRRYGTLWAYYRRRDVTITAPRKQIAEFKRRAGGLRFRRCATCGCVVAWEYKRGPDGRMGVNARLLDHAAMATIPISVLDGDNTWRVLEHYTKPRAWISPRQSTG